MDDKERLLALEESKLLDTPPELAFDRCTRLAALMLKAPISIFTLIAKDRQFFKSAWGIREPYRTTRQAPLSHSFCKAVIVTGEPLRVSDARLDDRFQSNPAIQDLGVTAYLGVPISTDDGLVLGSFCVIDSQPREWQEDELCVLRLLGQLLIDELRFRDLVGILRDSSNSPVSGAPQKEETLAMMVHDLRTPLSSVISGIDLARVSGPMNREQEEFLQMARQGGASLLGMVNDILELEKWDAGKGQLAWTEFSMPGLVSSALSQIRPISQMAGQKLEIVISDDIPFCVGDVVKLERIFVNLLGNAVQFTPEGGVIQLKVRYDNIQSEWICSVRDSGSGLAKGEENLIFEKFRQGSAGIRKLGSTGIGLAFCKLAVEAHGGRIQVDAPLGGGCEFVFTIPQKVPENSHGENL